MLSKLCQLLRRGIQNVDDLYPHSYLDTRGLRSYPKASTKPQQECPYKIERLTEGDCV